MLLESARALKQECFGRMLTIGAGDAPLAMAMAAAGSGPGRRAKGSRTRAVEFRDLPIAIGVAFGANESGYRLGVRAFERGAAVQAAIDAMTDAAKGEIDVAFVRRPRLLQSTPPTTRWLRARRRPLVIGCSVGHFALGHPGVSAGTLGCFVRRRRDGTPCVLSNNHVIANSNNARRGDAILQPGTLDGGSRSRDIIARLENFVPISGQAINAMDAAIARVDVGTPFDAATIPGIGRHGGVRPGDPPVGQTVRKVGRTTGLTSGLLAVAELDGVEVQFGDGVGVAVFDDQLEIRSTGRPFSAPGDSGSAIWDSQARLIGLLFAGGSGLTYANPIAKVLNTLDVDLI